MTTVLVCGGRDYTNANNINKTLSKLHKKFNFTELIHGGANGADKLAGLWAFNNKLIPTVFKADWKKYGKSAGFIRNKQMLEVGEPDLIIAFPGREGTSNMISQARAAGKLVIKVADYGRLLASQPSILSELELVK